MEGATKKEKYHLINSLLCLAKSLEKRYTTIDLRNEATVTGKVNEVDGYMNVMLTDAAFFEADGSYQYFPYLYIQARNIRNIHIPDNVKIPRAIKKEVNAHSKQLTEKSGKMSFKESRAKRQQKETLKLVSEMKKEKEQRAQEKKGNETTEKSEGL